MFVPGTPLRDDAFDVVIGRAVNQAAGVQRGPAPAAAGEAVAERAIAAEGCFAVGEIQLALATSGRRAE